MGGMTSSISVKMIMLLVAVFIIAFIVFINFWPNITNVFDKFTKEKIGELPDEFSGSPQERFKEYIQDSFLGMYRDCRSSENKGCWCMRNSFKMPNEFSMELFQIGDDTKFDLLNAEDVIFNGSSYVVQEAKSCLIISDKEYSLTAFKGGKARIKRDSDYYLFFEDGKGKKYKKELDPSFIFYKSETERICMIEESSIKKLNEQIC